MRSDGMSMTIGITRLHYHLMAPQTFMHFCRVSFVLSGGLLLLGHFICEVEGRNPLLCYSVCRRPPILRRMQMWTGLIV